MEHAGFVASNLEGYATKCAPHKALKLIAYGKLTFDERVVLHRVVVWGGREFVMVTVCLWHIHTLLWGVRKNSKTLHGNDRFRAANSSTSTR